VTTLGRLIELRAFVNAGPWHVGRSRIDERELLLLDPNDDVLAVIYGGHDLALYLEACAPVTLLGPAT
jgi:hypothetical protein